MRLEHRSIAEQKSLPRSLYQVPDDVLDDADLTAAEKREILAAWSSDRHAVPSMPWLREIPGVERPLPVAAILSALRKLDEEDPPPRGGVSARVGEYCFTDATPAIAGVASVKQRPREYKAALIAAHRSNIDRYCRLLATNLTELERAYLHKRIAEERHTLERLAAANNE